MVINGYQLSKKFRSKRLLLTKRKSFRYVNTYNYAYYKIKFYSSVFPPKMRLVSFHPSDLLALASVGRLSFGIGKCHTFGPFRQTPTSDQVPSSGGGPRRV